MSFALISFHVRRHLMDFQGDTTTAHVSIQHSWNNLALDRVAGWRGKDLPSDGTHDLAGKQSLSGGRSLDFGHGGGSSGSSGGNVPVGIGGLLACRCCRGRLFVGRSIGGPAIVSALRGGVFWVLAAAALNFAAAALAPAPFSFFCAAA